MTSDDRATITLRDETAWSVWLPTGAAFVGMSLLLHHLVFAGWAHSYDSAIYVRSLWGVANGELYNPIVELNVLSIHSNFVLFVLAPIAWLLHPALVLIGAQAVALAATVFLACNMFRRLAAESGRGRWARIVAALFCALAVTAGSPIVVNPFLFDVRPDLIAVPLLTWGLLRAHRLGDFDWPAVGVMCLALLVREEMMMVIVGAMVLTPWPRRWRSSLAVRATGTVVALAWWAVYWFGFRQWIGDGSYEIAQEVGTSFLGGEISAGSAVWYKLEILFVAFAGMGAMTALGWRWIGAALPGLLFLVLSSRMQELALNFHYVAFAAPGVIVAGCEGFRRALSMLKRTESRLPWIAAIAMLWCFTMSSALPTGGRFRAENFYLLLNDRPSSISVAEGEALRRAHMLLDAIPAGAGVAMPHELAAPLANRQTIVPIPILTAALHDEGRVPSGVGWVVLPGRDWTTSGRLLVDLFGFGLDSFLDDKLAVLAQGGGVRDWGQINAVRRPTTCDDPIASWGGAGLRLCDVEPGDEGRSNLTIFRERMPEPEYEGVGLALAIREPRIDGDDIVQPAWILDGLVNPVQIPLGASVVAESIRPVGERPFEVALLRLDGRPIEATIVSPEGSSVADAVPIPASR